MTAAFTNGDLVIFLTVGTLALAFHTSGVLGRLFATAIENCPQGPGFALRVQGVGKLPVFLYATLPQVLPLLPSLKNSRAPSSPQPQEKAAFPPPIRCAGAT